MKDLLFLDALCKGKSNFYRLQLACILQYRHFKKEAGCEEKEGKTIFKERVRSSQLVKGMEFQAILKMVREMIGWKRGLFLLSH